MNISIPLKFASGRFACLLFLLTLLTACKTGGSPLGDDYYIKLELNGSKKELRFIPSGEIWPPEKNAGNHGFGITALSNQKGEQGISIGVSSATAIKTGKYDGEVTVNGVQIPALALLFAEPNDRNWLLENSRGTEPVAQVTLTEITKTHIKGTFTATVYDGNDNAGKISNGEFYVKRVGN